MSSRNPEYQFIEISAAELESQLLAAFETITGEAIQPASPERIFIAWVTSIIIQERAYTNYVANQNIPSRAEGANLDALGELFFATQRPQAKQATCTMRFEISEEQESDVTIPAGTRITDANRTLIWETTESATIAAGQRSITVAARCQTAGAVGNGYAAGQINTIVDLFNYYSACANTTQTANGCDVATDDEFYDLLRESMDAFSTAGPTGAYVYHAKAVSSEIADVKAIRPHGTETKTLTTHGGYAFVGGDTLDISSLVVKKHGTSTVAVKDTDYSVSYANGLLEIKLLPGGILASATSIDVSVIRVGAGRVVLYALMADGSIAGEETKNAILAACNDTSVRPLTDNVSVDDPSVYDYTISLTYYIRAEDSANAEQIADAVETAVAEYEEWQRARLGRDINPSQLIGLLMKTGVKRVVIASPTYHALSDGSDGSAPQIAHLSAAATITNGGVEND